MNEPTGGRNVPKPVGFLIILALLLGAVLYGLWQFLSPISDCVWSGKGQAFVDINENGVWDAGEAPLRGVSFTIENSRDNFRRVGAPSITGPDGSAVLTTGLMGCSAAFEVYPNPVDGYRLTTPTRLKASYDPGQTFTYGFAPQR